MTVSPTAKLAPLSASMPLPLPPDALWCLLSALPFRRRCRPVLPTASILTSVPTGAMTRGQTLPSAPVLSLPLLEHVSTPYWGATLAVLSSLLSMDMVHWHFVLLVRTVSTHWPAALSVTVCHVNVSAFRWPYFCPSS